MSAKFQETFKKGDISYTHYIRTTDKEHKETVQNFWLKLKENGYIRKGQYEGWYSITDEAFVPSSQVKEIKDGSTLKMVSVETGSVVEKMVEENYIFPLSHFQDDLLKWLSKDVIKPTIFMDYVKKWIKEGLNDLSVSRPKSRLSWGIPVPDDDSQIIYVWLDALVNYLTVGYYGSSEFMWPIDCHVIGKDILKFHAIYWPAFLLAAGYDLPKEIFCHSHWTVNYEKMSKSKGNVIEPTLLINRYGCDGFRYFLLRASVPSNDTNYNEVKIQRMVNAELADTLGNLLSRSCAPALNPDQVFPKFYHSSLDALKDSNVESLINNTSDLPEKVKFHFMQGCFYKGIDDIMACLRDANAFMQFNKPWELVKMKDEKSKETLSTMLHIVLEVLRISGILLQPVIPNLSKRLLTKLQVPENQREWENIICFPSYHKLPNPQESCSLGKDSTPLFERRKVKI
ncbi:methionine--tRNA ligase, mitochondrial-like isoform X2 [Argiope bruennichi]|nr:methionine--tRNA ligase, mitochondrial-like isoform X2 [Argiope bruennichi]